MRLRSVVAWAAAALTAWALVATPASSLAPASLDAGAKVQVVATTSIVADVVGNVGGGLVELKTLMPPGADPHAFEPTPQDIAAVSDAHVIFANGVGLEEFLEPLLESAGATDRVVHVSHGILLHDAEHEDGHQHDADPHTWTDPNNIVTNTTSSKP